VELPRGATQLDPNTPTRGALVRRIVTAFAATVSAVVLLFSYSTSTGGSSTQATTSATSSAAAGQGSTAGGSAAGSSSAGGSSAGSSSGQAATGQTSTGSTSSSSGKFTGDAVDTRWGVVQVEVTVQDGKVTAADAVQVPSGNHRDEEINAYAVPVLNQEVLDAQSAGIDTVSGATVTSDGYVQSLQSALDAAHLA
jgi:uncharacterized protein with FMN-binding domain